MASGKANAKILVEISATTAQLTKDFAKIRSEFNKFGKGVAKDLGVVTDISRTVFRFQFAKFAIQQLKSLGTAFKDLADQGEKLGSIRDAFDKLGGDASVIKDARSRILGLVDSFTLMREANKGLIANVPDYEKNFANLADLATRWGDSIDKDATKAIEELNAAIIKGNARALTPLGFAFTNTKDKALVTKEAFEQLLTVTNMFAPVGDSASNAAKSIANSILEVHGEMAIAYNSNSDLIESLRNFDSVVNQIDASKLGTDLATMSSIFVDLASLVLPDVVRLMQDFARAVDLLAGKSVQGAADAIAADITNLRNELEASQKDWMKYSPFQFLVGDEEEIKKELAIQESNFRVLNNKLAQDRDNLAADNLEKELDRQAAAGQAMAEREERLKEQVAIRGTQARLKEEEKLQKQKEKDAEKLAKEMEKLDAERIKEQAKLQEQAYTDSIEFWRSSFENAITGVSFSLKDMLQQVAVGFAAQMAHAIFGSLGAGISSPQDFGGSIAQMIFGGGQGAPGGGGIGGSLFSSLGFGGGGTGGGFSFAGLGDSLFGGARPAGVEGPLLPSGDFTPGALSTDPGGLFAGAGSSASYATALIVALDGLSQVGKDTAASIEGLSGAAGAGIGAYFGGPMGATIGQQIGSFAGQGINEVFGFGSGPTNKETLARIDAEKKINEMTGRDLDFGPNNRFTGVDGKGFEAFNALDTQGKNSFGGIGTALQDLLGLTEDVGPQIGAILAEELGGNLDDAKFLVQELGFSMEDMKAAIIKVGLAAGKSWLEIKGQLLGVEELFTPGIEGVGNFTDAMQYFIDTGGEGEEALMRLRDIAVELQEAGFESFEAARGSLEEKFGVEQVEIFFQGLADHGITNFDQLAQASDDLAISVVAHVDSMGFAFNRLEEDVKKTTDAINEMNNAAANQGITEEGNEQPETQALGGVVSSPSYFRYPGGRLGLMGESGPEAIMPLTRIGGRLGVRAKLDGNGSKGLTLNMDLRGAQPGVGAEVRRAIEEMGGVIERNIPAIVSEHMRRGTL